MSDAVLTGVAILGAVVCVAAFALGVAGLLDPMVVIPTMVAGAGLLCGVSLWQSQERKP